MHAVKREYQLQERGGLGLGIRGLVEDGERGSREVMLAVLGRLVMVS